MNFMPVGFHCIFLPSVEKKIDCRSMPLPDASFQYIFDKGIRVDYCTFMIAFTMHLLFLLRMNIFENTPFGFPQSFGPTFCFCLPTALAFYSIFFSYAHLDVVLCGKEDKIHSSRAG